MYRREAKNFSMDFYGSVISTHVKDVRMENVMTDYITKRQAFIDDILNKRNNSTLNLTEEVEKFKKGTENLKEGLEENISKYRKEHTYNHVANELKNG